MKREKQTKPRNKKGVKVLLFILLAVFLAVFAYAAYQIYDILSEWNTGSTSYNDVTEQFVTVDQKNSEPKVNFLSLQENYPTSIGWIRIPDTKIDYPIAQADDNNYYTNHLLDGTRNSSGTIFIDFRNSADFSDHNTLVYGHHMKNGTMFAGLVEYAEQSYYENHPTVYLYTPNGNYTCEIFSAYIISAYDKAFTCEFSSDKDFGNYLSYIKGNSLIDSDVAVTEKDRIITLSTCTYEYDDARFLVHAKLIPAE